MSVTLTFCFNQDALLAFQGILY